MGNAGTTAMLLSLAIAVGNKLVGVVRGHWMRVRADRKKLAAQSRRIKRLEGELRAAKAAAMEAAETRGSGGGGGQSGSGGAGSGADGPSAGVAEALAVARAAQAAADSLRVQLAAAEQAAEAMETRARREMVQQEDEKLELEEAAAAAVAQMTQVRVSLCVLCESQLWGEDAARLALGLCPLSCHLSSAMPHPAGGALCVYALYTRVMA
jgi:hypothetical protein